MAPPVTMIDQLAHDALDAVVNHWPAGATALPARRYVSVGDPAFDCEQFTVNVPMTLGLLGGDVGAEAVVAQGVDLWWMRAIVCDLQIIRCVPTIDGEGMQVVLPTPLAMDDAASVILVDAQAMLNAVIAANGDGELGSCHAIAFESWDAVPASGGYAGGTLRVRLGLF